MERVIYLDSAATSYYRPGEVAQAVAWAVGNMGNCGRGVYETALDSARVIFETRQLINRLFDGYGPEQTAFTANSTESLNMAIKGLLKPGDRAVTTVLEHNSVLRPLYQMEESGVKVTRVGCSGLSGHGGGNGGQEKEGCLRQKGLLDMEAMRRAIVPGVKAVICTHGSNLTGNITDICTIGAWCREAGALFIVDASQTAGVYPISMKDACIDVLCFTGHKGLMGPQGTGGICVRPGLVFEPLISGGSGIMTYEKHHPAQMPTMLEAGTLNGHGIAGLRAALLWLEANGGVQEIRQKEERLAKLFYQEVKKIPGIRLYGDYGSYESCSWGAEEEQAFCGGMGQTEKPAPSSGMGQAEKLVSSGRMGQTENQASSGGMGQAENQARDQSRDEGRIISRRTERTAMVTLNLGDEDSGEVSSWLAEEKGVYTRSGGHCAPLAHKALGTEKQGAVRFSFSYFNTEEEAARAALWVGEY